MVAAWGGVLNLILFVLNVCLLAVKHLSISLSSMFIVFIKIFKSQPERHTLVSSAYKVNFSNLVLTTISLMYTRTMRGTLRSSPAVCTKPHCTDKTFELETDVMVYCKPSEK